MKKIWPTLNAEHCVSKYGVFSGPYFPVFSPNTGINGPEKTPYLDSFHAVLASQTISKAPALPVFECILSIHTATFVRSMLIHFKSNENFILGNHAKPRLIVYDFSKVLIRAYLFEFNGETSTEYSDGNHCVKIVRRISPYSLRMRENTDQNNSEYGHFLPVHVPTKQ